ncbi:MAG TPA: hypothetical protein VFX96_14695, partial [Pyrinomonadaceae bacterium]|nr:hypothetical protein [Pyrinomonadaceae bacterium]
REPGTTRGREATTVKFTGTVEVSGGVKLSASDSVKLAVDDSTPREIRFTDSPTPTSVLINDLVIAINLAFAKQVAQHDGRHIVLTSSVAGANSLIEFAAPSGTDATAKIFGVKPPRSYRGTDAAPARIIGDRDIKGGANLSVARLLQIGVNGKPPIVVDCAARAADASKATPQEVSEAINDQLKLSVATHDGARLTLTSPTAGSASQITLLPFNGHDARVRVLGDVLSETAGADPKPAVIEGEIIFSSPVNLGERRTLKLSVDGSRAVEINVAGAATAATILGEIIERINATFPGLASATATARLRLASPTRGVESRLSLLPVRALELIEYPPAEVGFPAEGQPPLAVRHGDSWTLANLGAADAHPSVVLRAPSGVVGPDLVNRTTGQRVRLAVVLSAGESAELWRDPEAGLRAVIIDAAGARRPVPPSKILAGPLGPHVGVPFPREWPLSEGVDETPATLQLHDPLSDALVMLRAQKLGPAGNRIRVSVAEAALTEASDVDAAEDGQRVRLTGRVQGSAGKYRLAGAHGKPVARLRAGPRVALEEHAGRVVLVEGTAYREVGEEVPLVLVVGRIAALFDVTLRDATEPGPAVEETYAGVVLAGGSDSPDSLVYQINRGRPSPARPPSLLVRAEEVEKAAALRLPRGKSRWVFRDCFGPRFDFSKFAVAGEQTRFAGGDCIDRGVFDLSHFVREPPAPDSAVFVDTNSDPPLELRFHWAQHQPGAFTLNLPADLPERFGGRFDEARFARGASEEAAESFAGVVTEPPADPDHIITRVNASSTLVKVTANPVEDVPAGFAPVAMPFRRPVHLTGGAEGEAARVYLAEKDVPGFIEVFAATPGAWGNSVTIAARKAGPARFDVTINFPGARFENARRVVLGGEELPTLSEDVMRPGPVGILQAKAAGVRANVSRDRADASSSDNHH